MKPYVQASERCDVTEDKKEHSACPDGIQTPGPPGDAPVASDLFMGITTMSRLACAYLSFLSCDKLSDRPTGAQPQKHSPRG